MLKNITEQNMLYLMIRAFYLAWFVFSCLLLMFVLFSGSGQTG